MVWLHRKREGWLGRGIHLYDTWCRLQPFPILSENQSDPRHPYDFHLIRLTVGPVCRVESESILVCEHSNLFDDPELLICSPRSLALNHGAHYAGRWLPICFRLLDHSYILVEVICLGGECSVRATALIRVGRRCRTIYIPQRYEIRLTVTYKTGMLGGREALHIHFRAMRKSGPLQGWPICVALPLPVSV